MITDRDRPFARLEPAGGGDQVDPEGRLAHLERRGIIRRGVGQPSKLILQGEPLTERSENLCAPSLFIPPLC